jgi:sugar lactone lactonase YvrE
MTTRFSPWESGDVFIAVTELNNPDDDHAGIGHIRQFGANLQLKADVSLTQTTHLVGGLKFDAKGVLWAFDSHHHVVLNLHRDGRIVVRDFPGRAFSHANFAADGAVYLGEHVVGDSIRPEIQARLKTTISKMPGSERFGDGHVFKFDANGRLLKEYATQTQGGMGGFLGVTMSALSPDGRRLVYCSETGPRLMQYDLANDRQLPDLQNIQPPFPPGPPPMFFGMDYGPDGTLYVLRGGSVHVVDEATGATVRQIPLEGFGWAIMDISRDGRYAFAGSFFSGEVAKIDLLSGQKLGSIQTGAVKALAGIVEYQGEKS